MRPRRQVRDDGAREPHPRAAKDTALFHGALKLIKEQNAELGRLRDENATLRALVGETRTVLARACEDADTMILSRDNGTGR